MIPWLIIWRIAPLDTTLLEREYPQGDEAHVADAREGYEALDICLDKGHIRAVDNGHDRNDQHRCEEELHAVGKDRKRDAQKP